MGPGGHICPAPAGGEVLEKLVKVKHLRSAAQQSASLIAQFVQAAADDITELETKKVDRTEIDAIVDRIHAEIFGGEVAATLCNQDGEVLAAQDGDELTAIRKTKKGSG